MCIKVLILLHLHADVVSAVHCTTVLYRWTGRFTSTTLPGLASNGQMMGNCWPPACTIKVVPPTTPCGTSTRYVCVVAAIDGSVGNVGDVGNVGGIGCCAAGGCCDGFNGACWFWSERFKEEREDKSDLLPIEQILFWINFINLVWYMLGSMLEILTEVVWNE